MNDKILQDCRFMLLEVIRSRKLTPKDLAECVDLLPAGASVLLERDAWNFDTCCRVAKGLGLEMTLGVYKRGN